MNGVTSGWARGALIGMLCWGMALTAAPAHAEMIGTEEMVVASTRADDLQQVHAFMSRQTVQAEFERLGVDPADASARVAALSDAELRQLAQNIDQQPAGADVLAVVGIVFIVLLILELVGVTNIFSKF